MSADIVDKLQDETYLGSVAVARDAAAEIERLRAALIDAHGLIDNDLVGPWIMAHKLDDVLAIEHVTPQWCLDQIKPRKL